MAHVERRMHVMDSLAGLNEPKGRQRFVNRLVFEQIIGQVPIGGKFHKDENISVMTKNVQNIDNVSMLYFHECSQFGWQHFVLHEFTHRGSIQHLDCTFRVA